MADPRALFGERRLPEFLGGKRVDYYIPPEVRQGIGALLRVGDMLNPVSAYREYIRDVGEGDVAGAATNLAGFVAPGAAGAIASRLGRAGIMAIEPYSDDAARALMEMLSPTGAPDDISRRQFMAGAGAAAVAPMLPAEELLELAGRGVARGGGRAVDELLGLLGRRLEISREWDDAYDVIERRGQNTAKQNGRRRLYRHDREYTSAIKAANDMYGKMMNEVEQEFFNRVSSSDITQEELESLSNEALRSLADVVAKGPLAKEAGGPELAERIYGVLASRRPAPAADDLVDITPEIEPYSDDAARALMETLSPTGAPEGIRAYHGSPHTFDRFDMSKVGTGEGAQAYGRGLYFAESEDVARGYRDRISLNKNQFDIVDRRTGDSIPEGTPGYKAVKDFLDAYAYDLKRGDISHKKKWWAYQIPVLEKRLKEYEDYAASTGDFEMFKDDIARMKAEIADYIAAPELVDRVRAAPRGSMYEVMIDANPEDFLDWDKPFESADELERFAARFDAIDPVLRKRIEDYGYLRQQMGQPLPDGNDIIREIMGGIVGTNAVRATEVMREAGIPGIRYLDADSRGAGEGSRNYVVFDDRLINIVRVYGIGGAAALLGVSAADVEQALAEVGPSSYRDGGLVSLLPI